MKEIEGKLIYTFFIIASVWIALIYMDSTNIECDEEMGYYMDSNQCYPSGDFMEEYTDDEYVKAGW